MNHQQAPLFDALLAHVKEDVASFHVPAHKHGNSVDSEFVSFVGKNVMEIDLTLTEDLDHFHNPSGVILEAERYAAHAFGADHAFFLVNGTTCGIQAMILSTCKPGDKILVPRNAHKSVVSGLIFSGATPIYIQPKLSDEIDFSLDIRVEDVQLALDENPDIRALIILNPTYFGVVSDLKRIVEICHEKNVLVLVDEAHGGHFYFHDDLPLTAMQAGADMAAISTHKMTGSMTQSSILLVRDKNRFARHDVQAVLNLLQTTSPSYVLLASLDTSRREMKLNGNKLLQRTIDYANWVRSELKTVSGCTIFNPSEVVGGYCFGYDPTKIVFNAKPLGVLGGKLKSDLRKQYKVELELSYFFSVLALFTIGDSEDNVKRLVNAVRCLFESYKQEAILEFPPFPQTIPEHVLSPRDAFIRKTDLKSVSLEGAAGKISAETIMAYPPGVPVIAPGERISKEIIQYIQSMRGHVMNLQGTKDPNLENIMVFDCSSFINSTEN